MLRPTLRSRRPITVATALVATLALAACGSTVQVGADGKPLGAAAQGSLGQPGALKGGGIKGPKGTAPGAVPGTGGSAAAGGGAGAGTTTATSSGTGLAAVSANEPIEVGIPYTSDGEQANAALGAAAITRGNEKADAQAVIDDINAHGGINGHRLKPIFFGYQATSSDTRANQDQAACAHFTEDNHIAVALGSGGEVLTNCLAKAGVLMINSGSLIDADKADLARFPYYFQLGTLSQDRMMADEVNTLRRLDYFSGWDTINGQPSSATTAKVGVLSIDLPEWKRPVASVLLPALAKAGYQVDPENVYAVYPPANTSEVSRTAADVNNATLHFHQNGVTHVIVLDASALITLLFAQSTRQQHYYPRLGMNTATGAQALYDSGAADNNFLNGAVGLGWLPAIDLSASASDKYATPATRYCLQMIKQRTGQTFSSTNAAGLALSKCDMGYLMADALRKAGKTPTLDAARRAIEAMGGSYDSPLIPSTFFSPTRHDAADLGFDMQWDTGCSCTKYVGKHTIP